MLLQETLHRRGIATTLATALFFCAVSSALAQDGESDPTLDALKLENDILAQRVRTLELENDLQTERTERIEGWGLPSFEGTASLEDDAGDAQASMLATAALARAALKVEAQPNDIVLAEEETIPGLDIESLAGDMDQLHRTLDQIRNQCPVQVRNDAPVGAAGVTLATAIATATEIAGMFRAETTYSALTTADIDAALLADMVATRYSGVRPNTPLPPLPPKSSGADAEAGGAEILEQNLQRIEGVRNDVRLAKFDIEATESDDRSGLQNACLGRLNAALAAADRFDELWITPEEDGQSRYRKTLRVLSLLEDANGIVTVDVEAGGTAAVSKHLGTFLAVTDPLRVQGHVAVTWTRYALDSHDQSFEGLEPKMVKLFGVRPQAVAGGVLHCATAPMSMRQVSGYVRSQDDSPGDPRAQCREIWRFPPP